MSSKTDVYADIIKTTFMQKVLDNLEEHREGIHVSDLVYDCIRRAYYNKKYGNSIEYTSGEDIKTSGSLTEREIMTFWIGKKIHELPITALHETPIEYKGVRGTFDEALTINGDFIIIDKKTVSKLPSRPYEHHKTQIKYYALMYWKTKNVKAKYGAVLYILKDTSMNNDEIVRVFVFPITDKDYEDTEVTFIERLTILKNALDKDIPPQRTPSFMCRYCPWQELCFRQGVIGYTVEGV